jgi:putative exosortase-associated protein (TIGR04073 family)
MRKTLPLLVVLGIAGVFASGCANVESKFGRGMANTFEVVRMGEMRRSMEQTALFDSPDTAYTTGFIHGLNRSLARTGIGIYEVVTAPLPPYHPVCTDYLAPGPVYPDNFAPGLMADSMFATDTDLGYSGGDVLPFLPGSRFHVFEMH